ncbi:hypothetical protein NX059_001100 [Plenodomus lindquistii]|nr:hypothetical protein NX059_001100 [Plenodomus lindquistii]
MTDTSDLVRLAKQLVAEGPHKAEHTARRVRGLFNGQYAFDTTDAFHVWEHSRFPQYYIPLSDFTPNAKLEKLSPIDGTSSAAHLGRLTVGNLHTTRVIILNTPILTNLVKIDFNAITQWFEEDVPIYCHPKDPYKRIDILPSTRHIKISLNGVTLAETSSPLLLLETTLRTRYYVPPTSVNWGVLTPSGTTTLCPYKGRAEYYHVEVEGRVYRDLVWYYRYPTSESAPVAGYLCFYNEFVDVFVDGVKEVR